MASRNPPEEVLKRDSLLEFPCKFPIKAMGRDQGDFESLVTGMVLKHATLFKGESVTTNLSSSGKYLAVTVTIEAHSKDQLDRIYQDLTGCAQVLMAL
jgi:putative lipoic acid-binding regulatory protein